MIATPMEDVAKIAAELTEAQRFALLNFTGAWELPPWRDSETSRATREMIALAAMGLFDKSLDIQGSDTFRFSPTGLAVKAHLEAQS